jgi:hypothetical protein
MVNATMAPVKAAMAKAANAKTIEREEGMINLLDATMSAIMLALPARQIIRQKYHVDSAMLQARMR